ncbi:MAG: hypothetical protein R2843_12000 [Thermomicrobiales bacterium]
MATQDMGERDLPAEIAAAETELASAREFAARRSAEAATACAALTTANEELERVRLRAEQDQALAREIASLEAERGRIEMRIEGFDGDLVRPGSRNSPRRSAADRRDGEIAPPRRRELGTGETKGTHDRGAYAQPVRDRRRPRQCRGNRAQAHRRKRHLARA